MFQVAIERRRKGTQLGALFLEEWADRAVLLVRMGTWLEFLTALRPPSVCRSSFRTPARKPN